MGILCKENLHNKADGSKTPQNMPAMRRCHLQPSLWKE